MSILTCPGEAPKTAALRQSESDFPSRKSATDSWAFRHRGLMGGVCLVPAALAAIFLPPAVADASPAAWLLDLLGWTLFLGYVSMRIWATVYIGGSKDVLLQTSGPYSITRNPLYLGGLCFALSAACFLKSVSVIALTFVAAGIYLRWVIPAEEKVLERIFGQAFVEYRSRTPRLIPRPSLYRSAPTVELNLRAFRTEAQRLWIASLVPFLGLHAAQIHDALAHSRWFHLR
ncbi:MAG: isoprenylcysteine carboxylmethyltransferase family protein [Candidatus Acidiferrales bacterium]